LETVHIKRLGTGHGPASIGNKTRAFDLRVTLFSEPPDTLSKAAHDERVLKKKHDYLMLSMQQQRQQQQQNQRRYDVSTNEPDGRS
jgi:hypothetical protein